MYATTYNSPFVPSVVFGGLLCKCIGGGQSQFCETSAKVTNLGTDSIRCFCELLGKVCG